MDIIKKKIGSLKKSADSLTKKPTPPSSPDANPQSAAPNKAASKKKPRTKSGSWRTRIKKFKPALPTIHISSFPKKYGLGLLALALLIATGAGATFWYFEATEILPAEGGTLREGVVGQPQTINPLYTFTQDVTGIDRTLEHLVYPRLFSADETGALKAEILESFEESEDRTTYTFTLRDDLRWDDGAPLSTDDILFTINRIQDESFGSPLISALRGAEATAVDERTFTLTLEDVYRPFRYNLTFGILPQHVWESYSPEETRNAPENLQPVGAGMFRFQDVRQNSEGRVTSIALESNPNYWGEQPNIEGISFRFYLNEEALITAFNRGEVSAMTTLRFIEDSLDSDREFAAHTLQIPQYFSLFFNLQDTFIQDNPEIRTALHQAISRDTIIQEILQGQATQVTGPLTPFNQFYQESEDPFDPEQAQQTMIDADWTLGENGIFQKDDTEASITILATEGNKIPEVIGAVRDMAAEIGIQVETEFLPFTQVSQNQIPDRDYQVLFVGTSLNTYPDPYVYWHSSQSSAPGFNLSQYSNANTDGFLEVARTTTDDAAIADNLTRFQEKIREDVPAVFLYSPHIMYYTQDPLSNITITQGNTSADRYRTIGQWFARTERTWKD